MPKKRKPLNYRIRHSPENINIGGDGSNNGNNNVSNSFQVLKDKFIKQLKEIEPDVCKDFLHKRLFIDPDLSCEESIKDITSKLTTIEAVKFATIELLDYIDSNIKDLTESKENDPIDDVTNDDVTNGSGWEDGGDPDNSQRPDFGDYENSFDNPVEGFDSPNELNEFELMLRESFEKTVDLLNEILQRLQKLEAVAIEQHTYNRTFEKGFKLIDEKVEANHKNTKEKFDSLRSDISKYVDEKLHNIGGGSSQTITLKDYSGNVISEIDGVFPDEWDVILTLANARRNIYLEGPTGCGKSFLSEKLAEALNLPFYSVSCTEGMSESEFKGWLLPLGDNGVFTYLPSGFINAYENGGVFCADEFDACDPNVGIWVNKAISAESFYLPLRSGKHLVKKSKDFIWVACGNTLGNGADMLYNARNPLDGSTMDRHLIGVVKMNYDPRVERKLIDEDVYYWGSCMREVMKKLQITNKPLSTRFMIDASVMKKTNPDKWHLDRIAEQFFSTWEKDNITRVESVFNDLIREQSRKDFK